MIGSTLSSLTKQTIGRVRRRTSTKQRSMTLVVRSLRHRCLGHLEKGEHVGQILFEFAHRGGISVLPVRLEGPKRADGSGAIAGQVEPLQWTDVNLDLRVVSFKRSKSGKFYRVPINDTALAAFKKLLERCDGTGSVIRKERPKKTGADGRELFSSRRWFENCLEEAKIEDCHWHDFRHTFASRLREANVQIEDIRYLIGHGAKSITERYAHPKMEVLRPAVEKLDRKPQTQTETNTDTGSA